MSTGYRHPRPAPISAGGIREETFRKGYTSGVYAAVLTIGRGASIASLFEWARSVERWRDEKAPGPPPEMPRSDCHTYKDTSTVDV